MAFTAFFLLLLALFKLPSTMPIGSALELIDSTSNSSANALVPSIQESYSSSIARVPSLEEEKNDWKKPRKKYMMCKRKPKSCKKLSKHHACCFHRTCANLYSSLSNCGSCGHVCEHGKKCCRGICVDLQRDRNHCGKCLKVCLSGDNCVFGMCGYD